MKFLYIIFYLAQQVNYIRNKKANIYHITGDVHYICAVLPGKRTVLTVHDLRAHERLKDKPLKKWIYNLIWVKYAVKKCKYVTAISEQTKEEILSVCPWAVNKVVVIPDPISTNIKYSSKEINVECPRLLFIGTKDNKNHLRMIEAIRGMNCIVDIIGIIPDNEKKLLDDYAIKYENSSFLSEDELLDKYKNCDVVMFASTYEGFGMPIVEGQMIGRPVLTSNISPMNTVAGKDSACLVDPYSIESISTGLKHILEDKEYRNSLIQNGRVNAQKYTANSIANMYDNIYEKIK